MMSPLSSISSLGAASSARRASVSPPASGGAKKSSSPLGSMEDQVAMLEQMRDLYEKTGMTAQARKMAQTIAERRKQMEQNQQGPRELSTEERSQVEAYLRTRTAVPASFPTDLRQPLEQFGRITDAGIGFTNAHMQDVSPEEAFLQLHRWAFHPPEEQVMYRTFEGGQMVMATLRPDYVRGLAWYAEQTRNGHVFYERKGESDYVAIDNPRDFLRCYKDDPENAPVRAVDGSYVPLEEARKRDIEAMKKMAGLEPAPVDQPKVQDLGDSVSIGGIVIKKRAS